MPISDYTASATLQPNYSTALHPIHCSPTTPLHPHYSTAPAQHCTILITLLHHYSTAPTLLHCTRTTTLHYTHYTVPPLLHYNSLDANYSSTARRGALQCTFPALHAIALYCMVQCYTLLFTVGCTAQHLHCSSLHFTVLYFTTLLTSTALQ